MAASFSQVKTFTAQSFFLSALTINRMLASTVFQKTKGTGYAYNKALKTTPFGRSDAVTRGGFAIMPHETAPLSLMLGIQKESILGISFVQLLENLHKRLETEAIDEFREHLKISLDRTERSINYEYQNVTEDQFEDPFDIDSYKGMLEDRFFMIEEVRKLSDELSILALFKHVEIHTKRVIKRHLPSIDSKKLFNINSLKQELPFTLEKVTNFNAFNELRLINNAIKHQGKVSAELARNFPSWQEGDEFPRLNNTYLRLYPQVKIYIESLVGQIASHSELNT